MVTASATLTTQDLDVEAYVCNTTSEIYTAVNDIITKKVPFLPRSKECLILLKPNLNSHMNALTGNTTDLRVIVGTIKSLKNKGYTNIVIGDGTSSGFYNTSTNVMKRLKIDRIAEFFSINTIDLNNGPSVEVDFGGGFIAKVAKICFDADYFINLPKLKMHFEAEMSASLKNLVGCLVGLDKQKVHDDLPTNILRLNQKIKPDLHIVDAGIVMEGLGPSAGTPRYVGAIVTGTNPYYVDSACAEIIGLKNLDVPTLRLSLTNQIITRERVEVVRGSIPKEIKSDLIRPKANLIVKLIYQRQLRKIFTAFRLFKPLDSLFLSKRFSALLTFIKVRQDDFGQIDDDIVEVTSDKKKWNSACKISEDFCPMGLTLPDQIGDHSAGCIDCLYCLFVCPTDAISVTGELGFVKKEIAQYGETIKSMRREFLRRSGKKY